MSKPSDTDRNHFRHSFERLPPAEQDRVLERLEKVLYNRSFHGLSDMAVFSYIQEIAKIFAENGMELPEYT